MIANLYAHVFMYLQDTMEWYLKKSRSRFRDAFNENFFDHFEKTIVNIENISQDILREVKLSSMGEARQTKANTDFIARSQTSNRVALDDIKRELEDSKYREEQLRLAIEYDRRERSQREIHNAEQLEKMNTLLSHALRANVFTGVRTGLVADAERSFHNIKMIGAGAHDDRSIAGESASNVFAESENCSTPEEHKMLTNGSVILCGEYRFRFQQII